MRPWRGALLALRRRRPVAGLPQCVKAHDNDHAPTITNNYTTINNYDTKGTALAIATSQIQFDSTTYQTQVGIGAGSFDGDTALSIGAAKRLCEKCPLVNGTIGMDGNKTGGGVGATWRF